jgi:uncharacterized protein
MLGVDGAASLQDRFIRRTVETAAQAATGPTTLWTDPDERHPVFRELSQRYSLTLARQPAGDLGSRMLAALVQANGPALVIGTDCPSLTALHLRDAAEALRSGAEVVVIPADDGGYVLIGMRKPIPDLFAEMAWGTDAVMAETRRRVTDLGLPWRQPAHLWDVDRPTDVRRMRREGLSDLLAGIGREPEPPR